MRLYFSTLLPSLDSLFKKLKDSKKSRMHAAFFLCVFCELIHKLLRAHNAQLVQAQALRTGHHQRHRLVLGLGV
jgi:hypothetical protein